MTEVIYLCDFQNQVFVEGSVPPSASLTNQSVRKVLAVRLLESPWIVSVIAGFVNRSLASVLVASDYIEFLP